MELLLPELSWGDRLRLKWHKLLNRGKNMTAELEQQTIKQVLDGDRNAFEDLVIANQRNVYNLALKITGNEQDALDLSQEAFIKAYRQLSSFRGESKFSVWLYRLTYNLCIDFKRKKPQAGIISLTHQDEAGDNMDMEIPDMRNLPEDSAMRQEVRESIASGIDELGSMHREILVMREITGMSYDEIAKTLKISEGTVKSRLARARMNLADILTKKGTFP